MAICRHLRLLLASLLFLLAPLAHATPPLDINQATADQIQSALPGIGFVKAQSIVDYRNTNGPFAMAEQLLNIKGVGPHTLERIKPLIHFGGLGQGGSAFFAQIERQNLNAQDQAIRQEIKRIVTRAVRSPTD